MAGSTREGMLGVSAPLACLCKILHLQPPAGRGRLYCLPLLQSNLQHPSLLPAAAAYLTTDMVIASSRAVMEGTIRHLTAQYGSARGYAQHVGLSLREISAIRRNLLADDDSCAGGGGGGGAG